MPDPRRFILRSDGKVASVAGKMAMLTQAEYDECCCCLYQKWTREFYYDPLHPPPPADCTGTPYFTTTGCHHVDDVWWVEGCQVVDLEEGLVSMNAHLLAEFYDSACTEPCEEDI